MSLENEFLLLYIYFYRKNSFTACRVFRKASYSYNVTALYFILASNILTLFKHRNT